MLMMSWLVGLLSHSMGDGSVPYAPRRSLGPSKRRRPPINTHAPTHNHHRTPPINPDTHPPIHTIAPTTHAPTHTHLHAP